MNSPEERPIGRDSCANNNQEALLQATIVVSEEAQKCVSEVHPMGLPLCGIREGATAKSRTDPGRLNT